MKARILATLGPSSLSEDIVKQCASAGVTLFRINLSHTLIEDVAPTIQKIQQWTDTPICLDSEGAQMRNHRMVAEDVQFRQGEHVKIHFEPVVGDSLNISFSPNGIARQFRPLDQVSVDFDHVLMQVVDVKSDHCVAEVLHGGQVGSNKAADLSKDLTFDALTPKDREAIKIGRNMGISNFALSFANRESDVAEMRAECGGDANIICKIESRQAIGNLEPITRSADQILIDRGDLSRRISIEKIPFLQRRIIATARWLDTPVFVATNLLESMITKKSPTRAEVNDVVSTLLMGANGLVLAAENAIGNHPVGAVQMIQKIIREADKWTPNSTLSEIIRS